MQPRRSRNLAAHPGFVTNGSMRLAQLTDIHLPIPSAPTASELLGKRLFGYLSWTRNRKYRHRLDPLERIVADCRQAAPALTVISGDLINISLQSEFSAALQWLGNHFEYSQVAYCPGNHDAYVRTPWHTGLGLLSPYMSGERDGGPQVRAPRGPEDFPFVRKIGALSVVLANSSPPTLPCLATGRLGSAQIDAIGRTLSAQGAAGQCRILVLHHPLTDEAAPRRKALDDRKALRSVVHDAGVELVLHGHTHWPVWASVQTRDGPRPVVGGGSASHPTAHGKYRPARYNLFSIEGDAATGWRIEVEARELDPASGEVKTAERRILLSPQK